MHREKDGSAYHGSPECRCGSRNQRMNGAGVWSCLNCGRWNWYRMTVDGYLAFPMETAMALDYQRAKK